MKEYIKVFDGIKYLKQELGTHQSRIGEVLQEFGFYNIDLFVSNDGKTLEKADYFDKRDLNKYLSLNYPVNSLSRLAAELSNGHNTANVVGIVQATSLLFGDPTYYWETKQFNLKFKSFSSLYGKTNQKEIVGYLFGIDSLDEAIHQQITELTAQHEAEQAKIAELEAQIAEQQKTIEQLTEQAAVTANYTTPALEALAAVIDEFWVSYDPSQPKTAQKQVYIKAWILENHPDLNPSIALWLDKIARHPTAK
ncbi:hypothetical protein [Faucicola atlantae]|uniref:hypothetical protein n=1 Tax=Faucicola atlantae TaxID=34059 RepID=UPI0025B14270|nr:hypothetical protein [Moraxella atlantae]